MSQPESLTTASKQAEAPTEVAESMRPQSAASERERDLLEEIARLTAENSRLGARASQLEDKNAKLEKEKAQAERDKSRAERDRSRIEKEKSDLKQKLEQKTQENKRLNKEIQTLKAKAIDLEKANKSLTTMVEDYKAQKRTNCLNSHKRPSSCYKPSRQEPNQSAPTNPQQDISTETEQTKDQDNVSKPAQEKVLNTKSLREPSGKPAGKQEGAPGSGMSIDWSAPRVIISCTPEKCQKCPNAAACKEKETVAYRAYVVNAEVVKNLWEYNVISRVCPLNGSRELFGKLPPHIKGTKQFGEFFSVLAVSLYTMFNVSFDKIHKFISGLTGEKCSTGWVWNQVQKYGDAPTTEAFMQETMNRMLDAHAVNCDETGFRCDMMNMWVHSVSTAWATYQRASRKRGQEGMVEAGFLSQYTNTTVHDCWKSYWVFSGITHALCNVHVIRELRWAYENGPGGANSQDWALELAIFLLMLNDLRKELLAKGEKSFAAEDIKGFRDNFLRLVEEGKAKNPKTEESKKSKASRKVRALLKRLGELVDDFLRFVSDFEVPFSNNGAEQSVRGLKTRISVSGCLRTRAGLDRFLRLFSFASTAIKQGVDWMRAFTLLIRGLPEDILPKEGLVPDWAKASP